MELASASIGLALAIPAQRMLDAGLFDLIEEMAALPDRLWQERLR